MYLNKVNVLEGQSFLDIAIQACGSVEAAFEIAVLAGKSITDVPETGIEIVTPAAIDQQIAIYYANKNLEPATALAVEYDTFDENFDYTFD